MTEVWARAALWLGLALVATLLSIWLGVATALSEIVVGVAQLLIGVVVGKALLGTSEPWVTFLSGTGAIILTFLAGAELDPVVLRTKWKETTGIGLVGFSALFGLTHGVIDQAQYSFLIAAVIGSAVIPTLIANAFFLPRYLLPKPAPASENAAANTASVEETL